MPVFDRQWPVCLDMVKIEKGRQDLENRGECKGSYACWALGMRKGSLQQATANITASHDAGCFLGISEQQTWQLVPNGGDASESNIKSRGECSCYTV